MPFADKDPRAVWRGSMNNKVRGALINATKDKEWADVQKMTKDTRMHMAEFCKYQFPVHTEGNSWSGRLRYLQNCNSIVVVHQPLKYQAHYYDLLVADGPNQVWQETLLPNLRSKEKHALTVNPQTELHQRRKRLF